MVEPAAPLPIQSDLPPLAVLGLRGRAEVEWRRLRALQYARLSQITRSQLITQILAAMAGLWLFGDTVQPRVLLGWSGALGFSMLWQAYAGHAFGRVAANGTSHRKVARLFASTTMNALVWALPLLQFGHLGTGQQRIEAWTILAMLTTVSAVVFPAVPLATALFAAIIGASAVTAFLWGHTVVMAGVALAFTLTIIGGAVEASRNYLLSRLAEAGMAERDEVVSLLLREHEEGEANWLWQIDERQRVIAPSERFVDAVGLVSAEIVGVNLVTLLRGRASERDAHASLRELADKLRRRVSFSGLSVQVSIRGEPRWWEMSGCPRFDGDGGFVGFRGVAADVTEQRERSERIAWLARYDTLTGLPNRMALTEALREAIAEAKMGEVSCAFLMLDLDRFKAVNDSLGHLIGDQLLARVAERLVSLTAAEDTCGRLGGDEFAVVIANGEDAERVSRFAEAIIHRLSEPYEVEGHRLSIGASVGSARLPGDAENLDALMRNADLALYRAKDEGGGRHFRYTPGMSQRAEERRRLETALRGALARNEIQLQYQPIVSTDDGRVTAYEAMARWHSPQDGIIGPDRFIPMAEETRMSAPIGEWVMRTACAVAAQWPVEIGLAVNVSAEQLLDNGFLDSVVWALASSGLAPQRLAFEVTEAIFDRDAVSARAALEGVIALGCRVTLDDFGTGQSALGHLRAMPFGTIKVDGNFVRGAAEGNRECLAILRAAVAVAGSLEMGIVAEGVEREGELALAREIACTGVQGFLLGEPIDAAAVNLALSRPTPGRQTGT